jgi:hypothetical protein
MLPITQTWLLFSRFYDIFTIMCEHSTQLPEEGNTGIIRCTGRDGQNREFGYVVAIVEQNYETTLREWTFHALNPHDPNRFFEFTVERRPGWLSTKGMHHHNFEEFVAKGIPEAFILETARLFRQKVCSTSNLEDPDFRTIPATKVWERLVARGAAIFHQQRDRYETVGA